MPRQFAITIGINGYRYYPRPLKYAEKDAVAMEAYLREVGFAEVLRYSDHSPSFGQDSTHPERTNLLRAITRLSTQLRLKSEDSFWLFFSGHGARQSGQDYLLPSDGDPDNLVDTAIPIDRVVRSLTQCGAGNLVLILDACRNQVPDLSKDIGYQTVELARQSGIITLFSCSPGERSYELPDQKQGAFTYALLKALRGDCPPERTNAQQLSQYLRQHVAGLAKTWGKQTPYVVAEPVEKAILPLLPNPQVSTPQPPRPNFEQLMVNAYQAFISKDFEKAKEISRTIIRDSPNAEQRANAADLLSQIPGIQVSQETISPVKETPVSRVPSAGQGSPPPKPAPKSPEQPVKPTPTPSAASRTTQPPQPQSSLPATPASRPAPTSSQPTSVASVTQTIRTTSTPTPSRPTGSQGSRRKFLWLLGLGGVGTVTAVYIGSLPDQTSTVDYSRLEELLKAGDWKGADQETLNLMLQVTNRTEQGWLDLESLQNFPCEVLSRLDDLWLKYSDGKFGFSVQQQIWEEVGSPREYNAQWEEFGDRVGWRKDGEWVSYSDLNPNPSSSPKGIFPVGWWGGGVGFMVFSSLAAVCKL